jgi:futalosine hydrolase
MNVLVVSATDFEIHRFVQENTAADILVTGVGIPSTVFHLTQQLMHKEYDMVLQAGIAGSFTPALKNGSVVVVEKDVFADIGVQEKGTFLSLFDMGFLAPNEFPYNGSWLVNQSDTLAASQLPTAVGVTINKITDETSQIHTLSMKWHPAVETMEGAAFHYVCLQQKVRFLQLRSISNAVGQRDKGKWDLLLAVANLNTAIKKLVALYS